jgi:hypothetical protein
MDFHKHVNKSGEVLVLRRIPLGRRTRGGFLWPSGVGTEVVCPDWKPTSDCGNGLHGWPWGFGLGEGAICDIINDLWLVIGCKPEDIVGELDGGAKCKLHYGTIRYEGGFDAALAVVSAGFAASVAEASMAGRLDRAAYNKLKSAAYGCNSESTANGKYAKSATAGAYSRSVVNGNKSSSMASGDKSSSAASGDKSTSVAVGDYAKSVVNGNFSKSTASGPDSHSAANGGHSESAASGFNVNSAANGNGSNSTAGGGCAKAVANGNGSTSAANGDYAISAANGNYTRSIAEGKNSRSAVNGDRAESATDGYGSSSVANGYSSCAEARGSDTLAAVLGQDGRVRVGERGAFAIPCWTAGDGWRFLCGKVGEEGIQADTWYHVVDGKLTEWQEPAKKEQLPCLRHN